MRLAPAFSVRTLLGVACLGLLWALPGQAVESREPAENTDKTARAEPAQKAAGNTSATLGRTVGHVMTLGDARFDSSQAQLGMWLPAVFTMRGFAGIYTLEPISEAKTPVLFVHGIHGTPRDFAPLIEQLDSQRYQFWFLYYPSGYEIPIASSRMLAQLTTLHEQHPFKVLHVVAHSMGGLVTRSFLNACQENRSCDSVRTFTSIATPFGGAYSAQLGVKHSPIVMPVWTSMNPKSKFLAELFNSPLPLGVSYHLVFGYRNRSLVPGMGSGDGTISMESQLRWEAQQEARSLLGLDEDHMSILSSR